MYHDNDNEMGQSFMSNTVQVYEMQCLCNKRAGYNTYTYDDSNHCFIDEEVVTS